MTDVLYFIGCVGLASGISCMVLAVIWLLDSPKRQLLLELYASGVLFREDLPEAEQIRLLDTVLAAAEGREFEPLGLPFPRLENKADQA